jgi:hypothetical protein
MWIILANAIAAGIIAGTGVIVAVAQAIPTGQALTKISYTIAICTALGAACKDWQSHITIPPAKVIIAGLAALCLLLSGCSGLGILQNPATDTTQQTAIMAQQNARGCIYFKANAAPWASVTTILVGTWGSSPPSYAECWKGLPAGMP